MSQSSLASLSFNVHVRYPPQRQMKELVERGDADFGSSLEEEVYEEIDEIIQDEVRHEASRRGEGGMRWRATLAYAGQEVISTYLTLSVSPIPCFFSQNPFRSCIFCNSSSSCGPRHNKIRSGQPCPRSTPSWPKFSCCWLLRSRRRWRHSLGDSRTERPHLSISGLGSCCVVVTNGHDTSGLPNHMI